MVEVVAVSMCAAGCVTQKSSIDVIQKNWFSVSSRKSSTAAEVQSYLSAFEHIQLPLLFAIVNLADTDVCTAHTSYAVSFLSVPSLCENTFIGLCLLLLAERLDCIITCWCHYCSFLDYVPLHDANQMDTMRYDSVCLTCSKKLTGSQLSLPHGRCVGLPQKKGRGTQNWDNCWDWN